MPEGNAYFDHGLAQGAKVAHMAVDDAECNEALRFTGQWAVIALDRLVEKGAPAMSVSGLIVALVHQQLAVRLLEPPPTPEGADDERPT